MIQEILNQYEPITLEDMKEIRLMNRIDTKFVTTVPVLRQLLELAREDYFVQETGGLRISPYYTLYFDTDDCKMYQVHEAGHLVRQKLRIRSYVDAVHQPDILHILQRDGLKSVQNLLHITTL